MKQHTVCIVGGSGFVGTHIASRLARDGHNIKVLSRRPERRRHLLVLPTVKVLQANVHEEKQLQRHFEGCDTVVNLVGILNEKGDDGKGFQRVHVDLAQKVVNAALSAGAKRLLHMSALQADAGKGASYYLRTKGEAENLVHNKVGINVTSFRPSVIFGAEDSFLNRFATLLRFAPPIMPLACPEARFAPIYVGDVAECFARALDDPKTYGQRYDLCGPHIYTLKELVEYVGELTGHKRRIFPLGPGLSSLQARVLEHVPGKPFSKDNLRSLQVDSVCDGPFPEVFGFEPTPLDTIAPRYLAHGSQRDRYQSYRQQARRGER